MDIFSKAKRSEIMGAIKGKDTKMEIVFRKALWRQGFRYRKNPLKYFGKPDLVFKKAETVIFLDSCFWHGCEKHGSIPSTRRNFWKNKIERNKQRDCEVNRYYKGMGWRVFRFWEHEIDKNFNAAIDKVVNYLNRKESGNGGVVNSAGKCANRDVLAIIEKSGEFYVGRNLCDNPQNTCPRAKGEGYEKCKTICKQDGHAEIEAIKAAKGKARGGVMYLIGHDHCCNNCLQAMQKAGIGKLIFNMIPEEYKKVDRTFMDNSIYNKEDEIKDTKMERPHVFILGAGASVAAFPNGDRNGRLLPTMDNFVEILNLKPFLDKYAIPYSNGDNFEVLYGKLYKDPRYATAIRGLEELISDYFLSLELPDNPTIYDHLVLSLRDKDLIATFNWDPFLFQAWNRNYRVGKPPHLAFLHGSVNIGYCQEHRRKGFVGARCPVCDKRYVRSKILYPIEDKNYNENDFLRTEWSIMLSCLKEAQILTIYGYGGPKSDIKAIELMKNAWGRWEDRAIEQVEVIDIKPEGVVRGYAGDLIHTHHYQVSCDFYKSWAANHPRRSCEAMFAQNMMVKWVEGNPAPQNLSLRQLQSWFQLIASAER